MTQLLGIGTDVADVARFARLVERGADRFWERWFTAREADQCRASRGPAYAAAERFAVKEAALKALGTTFDEATRWRGVEVLAPDHRTDRPLTVHLHDEFAAVLATRGPHRIHVATTRCGARAYATVLIEATALP